MHILNTLSQYAIPFIILSIIVVGLKCKVKVYDEFIEGAKEGLWSVVKILPALVGLFVAIGAFKSSGALDLLIYGVKPITNLLLIPPEVLPLVFLRPVSGSASLAVVSDILNSYGPDSFIGRLSSVLMGSTETIFYTLTVYFGSVGIKNIRYVLICAILAEVVSVIVSCLICTFMFL